MVDSRDVYGINHSNDLNWDRFVSILSLFTRWHVQLVHPFQLNQADVDCCNEVFGGIGFEPHISLQMHLSMV